MRSLPPPIPGTWQHSTLEVARMVASAISLAVHVITYCVLGLLYVLETLLWVALFVFFWPLFIAWWIFKFFVQIAAKDKGEET